MVSRSSTTLNTILKYTLLVGLFLYPPFNIFLHISGIFSHGFVFQDFAAYYNAGLRVNAGIPIYKEMTQVSAIRGVDGSLAATGFLYPPLFAVLFVPFTLLPFSMAAIVWNVSTFGIFVLGAIRLFRSFGYDVGSYRSIAIAYLLLGFAPTITWMKAGQISGLIAGLFFFSAASARSRNNSSQYISGAQTIVAVLVKPYYAPAGAHLLSNWRKLVGATVAGGCVFLLGIAIFGPDQTVEYTSILVNVEGRGEGPIPLSNWAADTFRPLYIFGSYRLIIRLVFIGLCVLIAFYVKNTDGDQVLLFAFGLSIVPIAAPKPNVTTLTIIAVCLVLLGLEAYDREKEIPSLLLLSAILLQIHPYSIDFVAKFGPQYVPSLSTLQPALPYIQPAVWSLFVLYAYLFPELRRSCDRSDQKIVS